MARRGGRPACRPCRRRRRRAPLDLRRLAPAARGVALVDAAGLRARRSSASCRPAACSPPLGGRPIDRPLGFGPDDGVARRGDGFAPLAAAAPAGATCGWTCRPGCWRGSAGRSPCSPSLVLSINAALVGAAALLPPPSARALGDPAGARPRGRGRRRSARRGEDEIDFLLATFERAADGPGRPPAQPAEDDIAALERTLSASLQSGLLLLDREGRVLALNAGGRGAPRRRARREPGAPLDRRARRPARAARDPGGGGGRGDAPRSARSAPCAPAGRRGADRRAHRPPPAPRRRRACAACSSSSPISPRRSGGPRRGASPRAWRSSARWPAASPTSCATASPPCAAI